MRVWLWALPLAWMGLIYFLSAQSRPPRVLPSAPDYLLHGGAYALLAFLLSWAAQGRIRPAPARPRQLVAIFIFATLYGISDEWHQSFVPGRTPELHDVIADAAGAALALSLTWVARDRRAVPPPPR